MTPQEVTQMLAVLKSVYVHHPVNDATMQAWSLTMRDMPYEATMQVVGEWMLHEEWFPTPAAIRERVQGNASDLPTVDEAWRMVMDRIRDTYPGRPAPDWDAPRMVQDALKDIGGTWAVRQATQTSDMERRFRSVYGERREREVRLTALPGGLREVSDGVA